MASGRTRAALERGAIALLVWVGLVALAMSAFALWAKSELRRAEDRFLAELESSTVEPAPSSPASLEYTARLLAAAEQLEADWPRLKADYHNQSPALLERIAPQLEALLGAAEVAPAHETLDTDGSEGVVVVRAARMLSRAGEEAARQGDETRQLRCAEALSAIARAFYRRQTLAGALLGMAVEQMSLSIVQGLVEAPATSPEALDRAAALLGTAEPPLRAGFASDALQLIYLEDFAERRNLPELILSPVQEGIHNLMRARALRRCGEILGEIDGPLVDVMEAEPVWREEGGPLEVLASSIHGNARDALVKARIVQTIHELGLAAVTARRAGEAVELTRPEILSALDRYWGIEPGDEPPGQRRTRRLLTWRTPPQKRPA